MTNDTLRNAIALFEQSGTVRGTWGPAGRWPGKVLATLWGLYRAGEIGYDKQLGKNIRGMWYDSPQAGFDLAVNPAYVKRLPAKQRLGAVSLLLVHEGVHATFGFGKLLDEFAAKKMAIYYYRELSGPGVRYGGPGSPRLGGRRGELIRVPPGLSPPYFKSQDKYLRRDQLIDYILAIRIYRTDRYIDAQWVVDHLGLWRGIRNRWASTKGLYIKLLAGRMDRYYTQHILDIMESVTSQTAWDAMMKKAGSLGTIQTVLEDLETEPRDAKRIAALQRRWKVILTEGTAVLRR